MSSKFVSDSLRASKESHKFVSCICLLQVTLWANVIFYFLFSSLLAFDVVGCMWQLYVPKAGARFKQFPYGAILTHLIFCILKFWSYPEVLDVLHVLAHAENNQNTAFKTDWRKLNNFSSLRIIPLRQISGKHIWNIGFLT